MQANDIEVENGAITGSLKYLSSGQLVTDWGAGNFIALKFTNTDTKVVKTEVGLNPSVSSGLVELDSDMNGVFKITDKDTQKFVVRSYDAAGNSNVVTYDLSGLTVATE